MGPSAIECVCCVCNEELATVSTLHYHQMCHHTTEELSLAILQLKGLEISAKDLDGNQGTEAFLLRNGLVKYPHFLDGKVVEPDSESGSESTATAESSKLSTPITTLDGEDVKAPTIKELGLQDKVTSLNSGINSRKEISVENMKKQTDKSNGESLSQRTGSDTERKESLMLLCTSDDNRFSSEREQKESGTDNDDVKTESTCVDSDDKLRNSENNLHTLTSSKKNGQGASNGTESVSSIDKEVICENILLTNTETLLDDVEIECTGESIDDMGAEFASLVKNEAKSPFSISSVDSFLSPMNSPHPERHIEAIISRLPNIVLPDAKSNGISRRNKFLLPSPVTRHHQSHVFYDYSHREDRSSTDEIVEEEFQEYFIPRVELGVVNDKMDASCGTNIMHFTEKHVQTNSVIVQDNGESQKSSKEGRGTGTEKQNTMDKNVNASKESQGHQQNTTVQKLALFRKVTKNKQRESKVSNRCSHEVPKEQLLVTKPVESRYHMSKFKENCYPLGIADRRFFCEPCGKGYKKKSHLERHLRVHTGERPFPCSYCEKRFAVRSILKQHIRIHTGEKPYSCSICLQRFPQKSGLMTHMMLHTGKPFKCDLCDKSFVSNHKLLQHLRCHDNQHAHVCRVCSMEFFTEGALVEHARFHTQVDSHDCMMCGASFVQEKFLKLHLDEHLNKLSDKP